MSALDSVARGVAVRTRLALTKNGRHARLLRAASIDRRSPATLAPWLAPPAYAASTAYGAGQVVAHGGRWYMCGIAGTSPASGTGPTATSGQYVQDGTGALNWTFLGGARLPDAADGAPVVSVVTVNPALGANWLPSVNPASYRVRGAQPIAHRTDLWSLASFEVRAGVTACNGASVAFETDADKVAIFLPSNSAQLRVIVDGRYLQPGSTVIGGTDSWMVIDWTAATGRRLRSYEVETGKSASYFGCAQTATTALVTAPAGDEPRMVVIGDSYNAGSSYGPWLAGGSIAQLLAKRLGWRDCWNLSTGGTGYLNPSVSNNYIFRQRVAQALALAPDVMLLMGSSNDAGYAPAAVQAEALATLQAIRAGGFAGPIIVVGVPSINVAGVAATEAAVQAAVAQFGDALTFFVPISGAVPPWVTGAWNNSGGMPAGTANASLYIGGDNIHPPEIGYDHYAQRIERAVRASVLPVLAVA